MKLGMRHVLGLLAFALLVVVVTVALTDGGTGAGTVAVIPITGVITAEASAGLFAAGGVSSTDTVRFIEQANDARGVKVILLEINSPGGSAVASDEIAQAVAGTDKPVVAWIRESGASGAYWIASESDWIIANRMSITGSVGVVASYLEFHDFLAEHNVTHRSLTGGEHKEVGSPFAKLSPEEEALLQHKIDRIHTFFLSDVQQNRNLTDEQIAAIDSGIFFLGVEALELGLVDELGGRAEVEAHLESILGEEPTYRRFERQRGFFEQLAGVQAFSPSFVEPIRIRS